MLFPCAEGWPMSEDISERPSLDTRLGGPVLDHRVQMKLLHDLDIAKQAFDVGAKVLRPYSEPKACIPKLDCAAV
jgi:hypothetical protein